MAVYRLALDGTLELRAERVVSEHANHERRVGWFRGRPFYELGEVEEERGLDLVFQTGGL
jgi:hypothetical protein